MTTYSWQYNGIAPFNEVWDWCLQHLREEVYTNSWETLYFTNEKAYVFFLLRWS